MTATLAVRGRGQKARPAPSAAPLSALPPTLVLLVGPVLPRPQAPPSPVPSPQAPPGPVLSPVLLVLLVPLLVPWVRVVRVVLSPLLRLLAAVLLGGRGLGRVGWRM